MSSFLDYELLKDWDLNLAHLWIQGSWSNKLKIILNQNTHMRLIWRLKCAPVWILPLEQGSDLPIYLSVINHLLSFSIHSSVHPSIIFLSIQPFSVFFFFFPLFYWFYWQDFRSYHQVVLVVKNLPPNAGDLRTSGLIPGSGRLHGEDYGNPL